MTDPGAIATPPARQMAELFRLTGAEAALAADLLAGGSVRETAAQRGRGVSTVRTQLSLLMAKTEVTRQSELMRLLASLPRLHESRRVMERMRPGSVISAFQASQQASTIAS